MNSPVINSSHNHLKSVGAALNLSENQEFDEAYYKPLPPGYSYGYLQTTPSEKFYKRESLLQCAVIALNSQSEYFTYNKVSHVCKNYSPKDIMTVVSANDSNEISFYRNSQWIRIYALSVGAGSKVYDSFINRGSTSTWKVDECIGTFCPNFFRHPILDFWNYLPIDEVKLVIFKNQSDAVTMTFNGRNTSLESWFSRENLRSSPWNDLASATGPIFSLEGRWSKRRVYIGKEPYYNCSLAHGWLLVVETQLQCDLDIKDHYPAILYSDKKSNVTWSKGFGLADSFAVFIHLRQ
ncbi:uncharacterized protein LOC106882800 isoform X2 [Octopus bimaculoides]|uniref:uncharacterized protein LOC106882800 isoform X2 n=1 Tax=Octopus bimaculoides TaxID=37653 RepID=UPI00071E0CBD|nr:uncharacterized protein LOC106882800 isoform X2 [Octopus bimaculoides]|eukprot:XP_014789069.1 PREDICTED: uncharacterized protein LOC106882800 [Octopus bimaculoides]